MREVRALFTNHLRDMNILSQKIKENEREFDTLLHTIDRDADFEKGISYEDRKDIWEPIHSYLHSSTIDILDTIERWIEGKMQPRCKSIDDKGYTYLRCHYGEDGKCMKCGRILGHKIDTTLTLLQDFIKETKMEIQND